MERSRQMLKPFGRRHKIMSSFAAGSEIAFEGVIKKVRMKRGT